MNANPIEITLELDLDGEAVAGRARCNGSSREFSGRIGLMALVDSLIDEARLEGAAGPLTKDGKADHAV